MQNLEELLATLYVPLDDRCYPITLGPIKEGAVFENDALAVTACSNSHLARAAESPRVLSKESYSFSIHIRDRRIVYTGDLGKLQEMDGLVDRADLLLTEVAHHTPERLFDYLQGKSVGRVVCLHVGLACQDKPDELLELGKPYLGDRLAIGYDGMELEV